MNEISPVVNNPVRSLQSYLRKISQRHPEVPPVIPDGKYGTQTQESVKGFQQRFGVPPTGTMDHDTWVRMIEVYREVVEETAPPEPAGIFPSAHTRIEPGEQNECLYAIQGMMLPLTWHFANLGTVSVTGVNDEECAACVRNLQESFGQPVTGVIDKHFWNSLAGLYSAHVPVRNFPGPPMEEREEAQPAEPVQEPAEKSI